MKKDAANTPNHSWVINTPKIRLRSETTIPPETRRGERPLLAEADIDTRLACGCGLAAALAAAAEATALLTELEMLRGRGWPF